MQYSAILELKIESAPNAKIRVRTPGAIRMKARHTDQRAAGFTPAVSSALARPKAA
jgi:hypothetical protein